MHAMEQMKWTETRVKDDKRLRKRVDELLQRYYRLPLLIQQAEETINGGPEYLPPSSLVVNYTPSEVQNNPHPMKEQQHHDYAVKQAKKELVVLKNEFGKLHAIRFYLSQDELTVWDEKYNRRFVRDTHVIDRLGWGNERYYKALDGLRGQIADVFRLW
ncbi:hypothetical protein [Exiguobacterium sp. 8A]|uniref:hypothetical protein n=2 Tax=unclassified Exiguobacterium TaxID=2644629 RepID=UPI00135B8CF2|nr:hypothetical protein [Exiguobacterium sp. 8A]